MEFRLLTGIVISYLEAKVPRECKRKKNRTEAAYHRAYRSPYSVNWNLLLSICGC